MQFNQVQLSAVAFVLAEAILGKTGAEVPHNRIARDLRDDAGRGNGEAVTVAVDDRGLRQWKWKYRQAVDENVLRLKSETGQREMHRLVGGAQDVDRVDLDGINNADRPGDRAVRHQVVVNGLPLFRKELLRIVQLPVLEFLRENDRRRYDWPGQRATPGFIDPGNRGNAEGAQFAFMPKPATPVHAGKLPKF